jgi:hypothetical protein
MGEYLEQVIQNIKQTWNVWVGVAGMAFAVLLCGLVFLFVWVLTPATAGGDGVAKAVVTRLPAPTFTPVVERTSTPAVDGNIVDGIGFGMNVEIFDTGGSGLRFRAEPGIDGDIQFIANDREVFRVEGGPVEEDGFVWWYLVSAEVSGRRGWAVSPYLQVVE